MRISCLGASPLQCVQLLLQSASFLRPDAHNDRRHYQPEGFDLSIKHRRGCSSPEHQSGNIMLSFLNKTFVFYFFCSSACCMNYSAGNLKDMYLFLFSSGILM